MTKCNKTLLIICLVLVFSISITFAFVSLNYSVNAEELTNNSILNFNQLVNNITSNNSNVSISNYSVSINSDITSNGYVVYFNSVNLILNHVYYVQGLPNCKILTPEGSVVFENTGTFIATHTRDYTSANSLFYHTSYGSLVPTGTYSLMICDLTQIFGAGNEPTTINKFKSYFNNDFYAYTTSTLISLSTLDAYNNGVNDTLSNLTYNFTAVDSYNRITNANVKINNTSYDSTLNKTNLGSDFVSLGVPGSTQNGVLYFPFSTTLNAGDTISLSGYYGYAVFGSGSYSVDIVVVNGDSYTIIDTSTKTGSTINDLKYIDNLKFTLPFSCSGIYFICEGAGVYVSNFTISLQVFNFQSLINDAYKAGQDSVDTATIESEAYQKGKQDGIALKGDNVWSNANEFIKNIFVGIFDILSIEFLPNVSLGTFVVIPLIFSVLFFIVKVSKGGGD